MNSLLKKVNTLRIVIERNINDDNFNWKLIKLNNITLDQKIISNGSEPTLEEAFKESKFAFYNTN